MADGSAYGDTSDQDLLARHVEGDPDAFGELVRRHRDRLWAVALRTLGDREEAADAVQDALVSAYRAAHTFRGQSAVTTWLHRITVNACLDRARKAASRKTSPVDDTERLEQLLEPHESASAPARAQRSAPPAAGGARHASARPAGRARPGGHAGLPGRGGRPGPRCTDRHGQEPVCARQSQTPASPHASTAGKRRRGKDSGERRNRTQGTSVPPAAGPHATRPPATDPRDTGPSDSAAVKGGGGRA